MALKESQILPKMERIFNYTSSDIKDRQEPDKSKIFVRSKNNGKLVSVSNLVEYNEEGQSPFLARYNRQKAVTISARLVGDYPR